MDPTSKEKIILGFIKGFIKIETDMKKFLCIRRACFLFLFKSLLHYLLKSYILYKNLIFAVACIPLVQLIQHGLWKCNNK